MPNFVLCFDLLPKHLCLSGLLRTGYVFLHIILYWFCTVVHTPTGN